MFEAGYTYELTAEQKAANEIVTLRKLAEGGNEYWQKLLDIAEQNRQAAEVAADNEWLGVIADPRAAWQIEMDEAGADLLATQRGAM